MKKLSEQKWTVINWSGAAQIKDEEGNEVAIVKREDIDVFPIPSEDTTAKAKLIATAPELLKAAKSIVNGNLDAMVKLKKAIKKATL